MNRFAVDIPLFTGDKLEGFGSLGLEGKDPSEAPSIFNRFISGAIGLMTVIAAIWFIFLFISGAIGMMTAGGDKTALEGARKRLSNGIIGLIVVVAAIFIIELIGNLIGTESILNPAEFIENFTI